MAWGMVLRFSQFKKLSLITFLSTALVVTVLTYSPLAQAGSSSVDSVQKLSFTQYEVALLLVNNLNCKATAVAKPKLGQLTTKRNVLRLMDSRYSRQYGNFHPGDFIFHCGSRKVRVPVPSKDWSYELPTWYVQSYLTNGGVFKPKFSQADASKAISSHKPNQELKYNLDIRLSLPIRREISDYMEDFEGDVAGLTTWIFELIETTDDTLENSSSLQSYIDFVSREGSSLPLPKADSSEMRKFLRYLGVLKSRTLPQAKTTAKALEVLAEEGVGGVSHNDVKDFLAQIEQAEAEVELAVKEFQKAFNRFKDFHAMEALKDIGANSTITVIKKAVKENKTSLKAVTKLLQAVHLQSQVRDKKRTIKAALEFKPIDRR